MKHEMNSTGKKIQETLKIAKLKKKKLKEMYKLKTQQTTYF